MSAVTKDFINIFELRELICKSNSVQVHEIQNNFKKSVLRPALFARTIFYARMWLILPLYGILMFAILFFIESLLGHYQVSDGFITLAFLIWMAGIILPIIRYEDWIITRAFKRPPPLDRYFENMTELDRRVIEALNIILIKLQNQEINVKFGRDGFISGRMTTDVFNENIKKSYFFQAYPWLEDTWLYRLYSSRLETIYLNIADCSQYLYSDSKKSTDIFKSKYQKIEFCNHIRKLSDAQNHQVFDLLFTSNANLIQDFLRYIQRSTRIISEDQFAELFTMIGIFSVFREKMPTAALGKIYDEIEELLDRTADVQRTAIISILDGHWSADLLNLQGLPIRQADALKKYRHCISPKYVKTFINKIKESHILIGDYLGG